MINSHHSHPKVKESERQKELEKEKQLFCSKCGAGVSQNTKTQIDKNGKIKGICPLCKNPVNFIDHYPKLKKAYKIPGGDAWYCSICNLDYPSKKEAINCCKNKKTSSTVSTVSIPSTISTTSTPSTISYLVKGLLKKERKPFQSIGRGIHNDIFYIGSVLDYGNKQLDCIITSDRKIYVDWGKGEYNEIKQDFGLNYRFPLFADCLDYWWSNASILKWLENNYTVDIKELFNKITSLNEKFMIYEDNRIHKYTALDIMRSYYFILFTANSRTYHHADPESGKTNQLMIYRALSFNPMSSTDFSSASIYRFIESTSGTVLIDDFDNLPDEQKLAILQHIRTNYKKFKTVRADGNKSNRPYGYNSYSHLVFNNVYGLGYDEITPQRLITIRLLKHKEAKDITVNPDDEIFIQIRDDLYIMALQYWKEVKEIYDHLKVDGVTSRELEVIKPILTIAKLIDEKLYHEMLKWFKELTEQEKLKDLTDDWEYHLLKELWNITYDKQDKEIIQVFVKDIAQNIVDKISDPSNENYIKLLHRLCAFVGSRLKGYLFKGGMTNGRTRYGIYKDRIRQILDTKGLLEIVEVVEGVEAGEQKEPPKLDLFSDEIPLNDKINELKKYFEKIKSNGHKITYSNLCFNFSKDFIEECKKRKILIPLPNGSYDFGGH